VRVYETVYRQVAHDVYVGGGFLFDSHTSLQPAEESDPNWLSSPYITYSQQNDLPTDSQQSAGFSVNVLVNRRDRRHQRAAWLESGRTVSRVVHGFLSGDSSWQGLDVDARAYTPARGNRSSSDRTLELLQRRDDGRGAVFRCPRDGHGHSTDALPARIRKVATVVSSSVYGEAEYRGPLMRNGLLGLSPLRR
jgi:hypothetical protein